jgi:hypothetical protein
MGKNAEHLAYAAREDEYEKRPIAEFDAFLPKNPLWLQ